MTIKTIDDIIVAYVNSLEAELHEAQTPEPQSVYGGDIQEADIKEDPDFADFASDKAPTTFMGDPPWARGATAQPKAAPNDEPIKPLGGTLSGPSYNEVTGENVELRKRVEDLEQGLKQHRAGYKSSGGGIHPAPVDQQSFSKAFERAATDHDIVELRRVLNEYRDRVNNLQIALSERVRQIDGANEKVANLMAQIAKLEGELKASTLRGTHLLERNYQLQMAIDKTPTSSEPDDDGMPRDALVDCLREKITELRAEIKTLKLKPVGKRTGLDWIGTGYQTSVAEQVMRLWGVAAMSDRTERTLRFAEEAIELMQACNLPIGKISEIATWVYSRPMGPIPREVGGTMVTLAGLCEAMLINLPVAANEELQRIAGKDAAEMRKRHMDKPPHIRSLDT